MILHGDCIEQMKTLTDNSVDAIITDPPYGLAFMNKKWDYDVPKVEVWREALRVLKPGGHLLSFGGTRTYHRMVVNIEDAGFEIRDQVMWLYGSGFPKSHNISKAIDKHFGAEREVVGENPNHREMLGSTTHGDEFQPHTSNGSITAPASPEAKQWDGWGSALKPANEPIVLARKPLEKGLTLAENVLKWGTGGLNIDGCRILPAGQLPAIKSPWENAEHLCDSCANNAESRTKLTAQALKESTATKSAELISSENLKAPTDTITTDTGCFDGQSLVDQNENPNVNSSLNTDGFGKNQTAQCPIVTASTTLTKTKKTIDLKTCGLCESPIISSTTSQNTHQLKSEMQSTQGVPASAGRWPSNLLLDEESARLLDEQSGVLKQGGAQRGSKIKSKGGGYNSDVGKVEKHVNIETDTYGASRFFYVAKASKSERNAGLEGMPEKQVPTAMCSGSVQAAGEGNRLDGKPLAKNQNFHPTVKPTKLMEYLCKLITPPGGTILDPFCGSGSTGVAAIRLDFNFIGCEMNAEYLAIAEKRIEHALETKVKLEGASE